MEEFLETITQMSCIHATLQTLPRGPTEMYFLTMVDLLQPMTNEPYQANDVITVEQDLYKFIAWRASNDNISRLYYLFMPGNRSVADPQVSRNQ